MTGFCGTYTSEFDWTIWIRMMVSNCRILITLSAMVIISWFIYTIDTGGEEDALDLVKDFTALAIIVEIDSMILGFTDIKYVEIDFELNVPCECSRCSQHQN